MFAFSTLLFGALLLSIVAGNSTKHSEPGPSISGFDVIPDTHTFLEVSMSSAGNVFKCETTAGSPEAGDLIAAAAKVKGRTFCCQDNGLGSKCQEKATFLTAAIGMCGPVIPAVCIDCTILYTFGLRIVEECSWYDKDINRVRAGGYMDFVSERFRAIAYHS